MKNNNKAFTLVELLIYMGIFSVFLIVLTNIFVSVLDVREGSESTSSVEQDGNYILNRFKYDIVRADSIITPASVGAKGNTLNITIGGVNNLYFLNNGNLNLTVNSVTDQLNSVNTTISNPNNSLFTRIGNGDGKDTIQISFIVTSLVQKASGSGEIKSFQTTVGPR